MRLVTNVSFERHERDIFRRAAVWSKLCSNDQRSVLERLKHKDPTGIQYSALMGAKFVLLEIIEKALYDIALFETLAETAPEEWGPNSIVANPKQAAQVIVEARRSALEDAQSALLLIREALPKATDPYFEED